MRKHVIIASAAALLAAVTLSGCAVDSTDQANEKDRETSGTILATMERNQPAPVFPWSQIRQTLNDAETATAQTTQTTTFFFNQGVADPVFTCPSIGFPVPATSEITNPEQVSNFGGNGGGNVTTPQIDPNGIYMGTSTATYVICVNAQGKMYLHHAEEFAHAVSGPATWDYTHHRIEMTGDPTFKVKVGQK